MLDWCQGQPLADFGNTVVCVDTDHKKVKKLLEGGIPIFEAGLDDVVQRTVAAGRLSFTTDTEAAIVASEVVFIAVGTPPADEGSADLKYVEAAARSIGQAMDGYRVIVDKSTVPIGTARKVRLWIAEELAGVWLTILMWYPKPSSCGRARRRMTSCTRTGWCVFSKGAPGAVKTVAGRLDAPALLANAMRLRRTKLRGSPQGCVKSSGQYKGCNEASPGGTAARRSQRGFGVLITRGHNTPGIPTRRTSASPGYPSGISLYKG